MTFDAEVTLSADLLAVVLAREFVAAALDGMRTLAVTGPLSLAAGLLARSTGASRLSLAPGFCTLDAEVRPAISLGEWATGGGASVRGTIADTFGLLARGRAGVAVSPAQIDGRGATNLSRVGGSDERPALALPGSRGLPENNDSPSMVAYLVADHSPRRLVAEVDFVSGPPPSPGRRRVLVSPLGVFDLLADRGFVARSLSAGTTPTEVAERTGFAIAIAPDVPVTSEPSPLELDALARVDPDGLRFLEAPSGADVASLVSRVREREAEELAAAARLGSGARQSRRLA